eukprot:SAG11_NODE_13788_length_639_cov_1.437037_1_plen_124_part_00
MAGSIIDTHQHLWNLQELDLGWLTAPGVDMPQLQRNFSPEDYKAAISGLGVIAAIYAEVEADAHHKEEEVGIVGAFCTDATVPTIAMVASADPAAAALPSWIDQPHVKAVRWGIHFLPQGSCL